ncbi:MAG: AzlC family ABC transporter permease [Erysipelotrichaceae bacterium]|nr:AzlC family ABC transporter permease [Erysipelotrichaceae bacterium]
MERLKNGLKVGIPIGLGYFAVAFSLGIVASKAGLTPFQGFITSLLVNASAGESAGFTVISEQASYLQMFLITIVANARYILMSFALSQKINPRERFIHRFLLGYFLTDEYFAMAISQTGFADPFYSYGAIMFAVPCWALGTALGIIMGNALPFRIVSALSVALYGMFLAIIMPASRKDRNVAILVALSCICSYLIYRFTPLSTSMTTIVLTVALSALGALIFKRKEEDDE